jgi:hypothetical protein
MPAGPFREPYLPQGDYSEVNLQAIFRDKSFDVVKDSPESFTLNYAIVKVPKKSPDWGRFVFCSWLVIFAGVFGTGRCQRGLA